MSQPAEILERGRPFAIVRLRDLTHAVPIAGALAEGGMTHIEFSLTNRDALAAVAAVRAAFGTRVRSGVGTVLTRDDAADAIDAGAEFLVTPVVAPSVIGYANDHGVPVACGAFTPTEMHEAHLAGAAYVKLFPAGRLGPAYVKDVLAPLPHLRIVCVGGIDASNCASYLATGAYSVGIGGSLIDPADVDRQDWPAIASKARACVEACRMAG